jgi:hypothetical protein
MEVLMMEEKMYSYDIVEYDKGIVYACDEVEARNKVKDYYRSITDKNVDDKDDFDFCVDEIRRDEGEDVIVTVPW